VSGEFRYQATSILIAELFERHDKNRFTLHAFDNGWDDCSALRARINKACEEIVDIAGLGDVAAATAIEQRQIDILFDLNGYFGSERTGVFACRPAPVQVNLGFPGTMGADYMDYILADATVIPPDQRGFYTEKVVYSAQSRSVRPAGKSTDCRTRPSCSAASTTATRSRLTSSTYGCGCSARSRAAYCGCSSTTR
jgi:predicted O-linked N-acetylglucosamine transferase (SPINDLY family)